MSSRSGRWSSNSRYNCRLSPVLQEVNPGLQSPAPPSLRIEAQAAAAALAVPVLDKTRPGSVPIPSQCNGTYSAAGNTRRGLPDPSTEWMITEGSRPLLTPGVGDANPAIVQVFTATRYFDNEVLADVGKLGCRASSHTVSLDDSLCHPGPLLNFTRFNSSWTCHITMESPFSPIQCWSYAVRNWNPANISTFGLEISYFLEGKMAFLKKKTFNVFLIC